MVLPVASRAASFSGVSLAMPRRSTCWGVVRASISTLARAAALQAESQPSMSNQGSASETPSAPRLVDAVLEREPAAHGRQNHFRSGVKDAREALDGHAGQVVAHQVVDRRAVHGDGLEAELQAGAARSSSWSSA